MKATTSLLFVLGRYYQVSADGVSPLIWSTTGGGWRSMASNMGAAQSFAKIGLFGSTDDEESSFGAISTTSGSSWFSLQFFYSEQFYEAIVGSDATPASLAEFMTTWMQSYGNMQVTATTAVASNSSIIQQCEENLGPLIQYGSVLPIKELLDLCQFFTAFQFNWANFVYDMLNATSTDYGDADFASRKASFENKVSALTKTNLHIQTTLLPNMRSKPTPEDYAITYLAPKPLTDSQVYTIPLARQWTVKEESAGWFAGGDSFDPFPEATVHSIFADDASSSSNVYDRFPFPLYPPASDDSLLATPNPNATVIEDAILITEPFGGKPSVSQVGAASSGTVGYLSPSVPSFYAQYFSVQSFLASQSPQVIENTTLGNDIQKALTEVENMIWRSNLFSNFAVCGAWKEDDDMSCDSTDVWFADGGYSDGPAFALTLAQVQAEMADKDNSEDAPIKLILSNNNYYTDSLNNILQYFNTSFNQGIDPGEFIWGPATGGVGPNVNPWMSQQLFEEYLDTDMLINTSRRVPGTNITTTILEGTTINNNNFSIKAGKKVLIFLIMINSGIPTFVIGPDTTTYTPGIISLTETIASSTEFQNRVKEFVFSDDDGGDDHDEPTLEPISSPSPTGDKYNEPSVKPLSTSPSLPSPSSLPPTTRPTASSASQKIFVPPALLLTTIVTLVQCLTVC